LQTRGSSTPRIFNALFDIANTLIKDTIAHWFTKLFLILFADTNFAKFCKLDKLLAVAMRVTSQNVQ